MMDDRKFDELVEAMKNEHNVPPATPRDRMWERIDAARADRRVQSPAAPETGGAADDRIVRPDFAAGRWGATGRIWRIAAAAAAVLVLGIAIGRMTLPGGGPVAEHPVQVAQGPLAGRQDPAPAPQAGLLYQKAAADLFGRADALLTDFRVSGCAEQDLALVPDWAGGMLVQTRLLLNTPVARDPEMNSLLLDLELVLAQIVGISRENCARDAAWIRDALDSKSTIDRMRLLQPELAAGKLAEKAI